MRPEALRPWHYEDPFFQEAPETGRPSFDRLFAKVDLVDATKRTYDAMGLDVSKPDDLGWLQHEIQATGAKLVVIDSLGAGRGGEPESADLTIKTFNALLMIARAEAGTPSGALSEIDLSAVVADVAELYGPLAEDEGLTLETDVAEGVRIHGNRELLEIIAALCSCGRLAHFLNRRHEKCNQDGDNGDDHEKLNQRETRTR